MTKYKVEIETEWKFGKKIHVSSPSDCGMDYYAVGLGEFNSIGDLLNRFDLMVKIYEQSRTEDGFTCKSVDELDVGIRFLEAGQSETPYKCNVYQIRFRGSGVIDEILAKGKVHKIYKPTLHIFCESIGFIGDLSDIKVNKNEQCIDMFIHGSNFLLEKVDREKQWTR